ncbi:protease complex subunit PrcB family protein [Aquibacillus sp. 3ASR75-11]|uniref:Protease complex subunit PrcB family protein n=1 Tax=Terrihalobacillus insolitus TaxID=2950438 RepID=A0A9X3WUU2_9BACI|nr:protease complex subunit PrcB family protein [Terrihalobacillus insolitus]MDC3414485.1 protease complex subunit PrcB family protein [Terrihalobacillus insolitus]MDC3426045.1 protease complex subunit PrcB family protein [Terrihalobacillus insolitus]
MKIFLVATLLLLSTVLFGCSVNEKKEEDTSVKNEETSSMDFEVYEDIERNVDLYPWYSFREELPIGQKDKWFDTRLKGDKTYVIILGGEQSNGGYHLEIGDVTESENVITINAKLVSLNEGTDAFYTPISVIIFDDANFNKEIEVKWDYKE